MDNCVRDLDQIQEDEGDDRARRLGTMLMAAAAIVGLTLALGVVVGRAAQAPAPVDDPLAKLEQLKTADSAPKQAHAPAPTVEAADLTFPNALAEDEDRPEVLAALKAAAAEEAALAPSTGAADEAPVAQAAVPAAAQPAAPAAGEADQGELAQAQAPATGRDAEPPAPAASADSVTEEEMVANIPAALAAGSGARSLRKVVEHDPLVAAAIHNDDPKPAAPHGHEGEYTLQVVSFDKPEPSRAFAEGLRAKGHMAFVVAADVPDRGRYWRVRIGPFKTHEQAEAYRHKFEDQEHMNTFVVREKDK